MIWSAEAARSHWVRAEADAAREAGTLVQLTIDGATPPMPFNQIQCADLKGWAGDQDAAGWRKIVASVAELAGGSVREATEPPAPTRPPTAPPSDLPSVAVLPFANLSGDPDQDYFADGMDEEIVAGLARSKSFLVLDSGVSRALRGRNISPQGAGRLLGVRYLVDGSVRRGAARVRIAVKLSDTHDGHQMWADRFEDTLEDVFALQDRVAMSVAGAIEPKLLATEIARSSRASPTSLRAYDLHMRALALLFTFTAENIAAAEKLWDQAVALDPAFAPALAGLAWVHGAYSISARIRERHQGLSKQFGDRAVSAAPDVSFVLGTVADAMVLAHADIDIAITLADRARGLNPGSQQAWFHSGYARVVAGDLERGVDQLQTSLRLDAGSLLPATRLAWIGVARFSQRRLDEALALAKEAASLAPHYSPALVISGACLAVKGDIEGARKSLKACTAEGVDLASYAEFMFRRPDHLAYFREALALAGEA
ncbi:MAG TPA: hypothetical protein VGS12_15405 [Caulobacteraceae bacterium]|nr:hypothetical protein [Caulobacteraceae bacterium]